MCKHPNIVRFFFSSVVSDQLWLLMEYVAGGSASHVLRKMGPMPEPVCAVIVHDTVAALHYLNRDGRMHLDIKPGNILLTLDGRCKLCDFGVAQAVSSVVPKPRSLSESQAEASLKEDVKPSKPKVPCCVERPHAQFLASPPLLQRPPPCPYDFWTHHSSHAHLLAQLQSA
jgi:serine/threonine protein kinase